MYDIKCICYQHLEHLNTSRYGECLMKYESDIFDIFEVWWSLPESICLCREHGCIPCNVKKNAASVLTCHYSNTNLKNSRQRHGNKKCGGRGPFRFLNSVNCDCVTQVKFPARTFRFVSSPPHGLKEHCGKPAPFNAYWFIYRCV